MLKLLAPGAALALSLLAGCHTSSPTISDAPPLADAPGMPPPAAAPAPGAPTEAAARAAVTRHIQTLPNAALFVPDSARVIDNAATWQVLVPRTDWAQRMPNRARFEVNKQTGEVGSAPMK